MAIDNNLRCFDRGRWIPSGDASREHWLDPRELVHGYARACTTETPRSFLSGCAIDKCGLSEEERGLLRRVRENKFHYTIRFSLFFEDEVSLFRVSSTVRSLVLREGGGHAAKLRRGSEIAGRDRVHGTRANCITGRQQHHREKQPPSPFATKRDHTRLVNVRGARPFHALSPEVLARNFLSLSLSLSLSEFPRRPTHRRR